MSTQPKPGKGLARLSGWRGLPLAAGVVVAAASLAATLTLAYLTHDRAEQAERLMTMVNMGVVRSHLEGALNARLLLGRGMVSYLEVNQGLTSQEFQAYAERLVGHDPVIRNLSMIKGSVIVDAYPRKGNEKALGVDLLKVPAQRDTFLKAIESRSVVVVGPIDLVQGGKGLVNRIPVYLRDPAGGQDVYWGQVSMVLAQEALIQEAGLRDGAYGLRYALGRRDGSGQMQDLFWGNASVFADAPATLDVLFPSGSWRLAAVPAAGWGTSDGVSGRILAIGCLLGLAAGYLVFRILGALRTIHELESILPICSNCKKVRDDRGYWEQVESYLSASSNLRFSHGLCPECLEKLYGDLKARKG
ncbi:MAG TPA: CHASE domain-containing protein [Holophaga sp.]|nr:CHASE domain-containing protein [Holophaga sp.]